MNNVSEAIFCCLSGRMCSNVRMLSNRSASLIKITRTSSLRVSNIFRKFSAWALVPGSNTPLILVNPSTMTRSLNPNICSMSSSVIVVSSTVSCNSAHTMLVVPSPISSATTRATAMGW